MIDAEMHTDDYVFEVDFDATPWFERASDQDILELAGCDWGGDYPADGVAEELSHEHAELREAFNYVGRIAGTRRACGFEVHVDEDQAMRWLERHRVHLYAQLADEEDAEEEDGPDPMSLAKAEREDRLTEEV